MARLSILVVNAGSTSLKLDLVDAQLALAALAALPGPGAKAGADALIEISTRYGLTRAEELILGWLDRRGLAD